jgi:hypothetical protein
MLLRGRSGHVLYSLPVSVRGRLPQGLHAGEPGGGDKCEFEGFINIHHLAQRGGERFVFDRKKHTSSGILRDRARFRQGAFLIEIAENGIFGRSRDSDFCVVSIRARPSGQPKDFFRPRSRIGVRHRAGRAERRIPTFRTNGLGVVYFV